MRKGLGLAAAVWWGRERGLLASAHWVPLCEQGLLQSQPPLLWPRLWEGGPPRLRPQVGIFMQGYCLIICRSIISHPKTQCPKTADVSFHGFWGSGTWELLLRVPWLRVSPGLLSRCPLGLRLPHSLPREELRFLLVSRGAW